jgi:mannonate dehydratase
VTPPFRDLLGEGFRWFGPGDPVPLAHIGQTGATEIFTSLHQIPYGEVWPREAIRERKAAVEAAGLRWSVVESVPVHEDIKRGAGRVAKLLENYRRTLRNLAAEGIALAIYNFMPVLDWIRTEMRWRLPDGSEVLHFDPVRFAAFDLFALRRAGAEDDHPEETKARAAAWWNSLGDAERERFVRDIIDVFPGVKWGLSLDDIRAMLARYRQATNDSLSANLARFLDAVLPVAEACGARLAIHPDDPPFPVLGLPRIVSTTPQIARILQMADSPAHGLCLCTGSLGARADNDLPAMVRALGPRIHAVHLRNTRRLPDGCFFESGHIEGSTDMPAVVAALLAEQDRRRAEGREDWRLVFRPDHGRTMMDDLGKPPGITPGYPAIGRMRGLAELRGLMHGLRHCAILRKS